MRTSIIFLVAVLCGCSSSRDDRSRLDWTDGAKRLRWSSTKDYAAGLIELDPVTGRLTISNLSAQVDQGAVQAARDKHKADADSASAMFSRAASMLETGAKAYMREPTSAQPLPELSPQVTTGGGVK